ncbi:DUF2971 domain-containing protein [Ochrobactrum sp. SFR4]|uniref:DUF2971 domain-containing protein n=1 Tax=Ochrobactrum sp. SFR4 TaxID=2717368 RepID=UPI001C8CC55D|nr:DUF2971 domain-containing protein [Ochrobactrum sp. SFR4]MBX8827449.1 DUF2971 domain-containing protein [Ochrobactrum sp. SFR4]
MKDSEMLSNDFFSPEDFEISAPPPFLYKYMVADRVDDVLDTGHVKFTHLMDTNDSFEVRKTFKRFAGPKFIAMMTRAASSKAMSEHIDQQFQQKLAELTQNNFHPLILEQIKQSEQIVKGFVKSQLESSIGMLSEQINNDYTPEKFLSEMGATLLCFSLSERYDTAAMWAHYGGNHKGFVIAFDTSHPWFKNDKDTESSKLKQIIYLDDQKDELFDDLQAAFSSKATDWAYEREWRMNCTVEEIERTVGQGSDCIHLRSFPSEAVSSVILGAKASSVTADKVRDILNKKYPHAKLQRVTPQPMMSTYLLSNVAR